MKEDNIILQKSYAFAVRIVRLSQFLVTEKHAYQLADQIRRSGTSVGANVEEAIGGQSRRDFVAKCSIAYKEARETHYWLRLLRDTGYLEYNLAESLLGDCEELRKILTAILKSAKS
ncbi:four helix bundle protein [Hymenobacter luteus]|uniref:Four helix bundle protein n=2 Tax=Hymenobacter TaxID=89966 RepID=A0A7W9T016_9BACT|nr:MULTISPECIES: four helix bundle protein [Hymenobacter]MBB4600726.1 four helix bundle protein [Hymenobacter latericoloratus]MBB6059067.1 four helix bundle protein [Hymenobacter luteus]